VYADLDITDSEIKTLNVSPRVGITTDLGQWGALALYTGATYLKADLELTGRVTIPLGSDIGFLGKALEVDYAIDQRNKDKWNFLVGGNWDIAKSFGLQAEVGFGESRNNVISSVTYRF